MFLRVILLYDRLYEILHERDWNVYDFLMFVLYMV